MKDLSSYTDLTAARTVDRLSRLDDDFAGLHRMLKLDRLVAGTVSLPALATRYANLQGLTAASLSLLLSVAEQPWAHEVAEGRSAVEYLGHLTRAAGNATASIAGAAALAAEFHRIDGRPDPAAPQPARFRVVLDLKLAEAAALIKDAPALCASAARFIEEAARTADRATGAGPTPATAGATRDTTWTGAPVKATDTQHRALEVIARHNVRVHMGRSHRQNVVTGTTDRITLRTTEALHAKGLIRRDSTTSLYTGQRLRLTEAGRHTLHVLGPAPAAVAGSAQPARSAARAR